MQTRSKQVKITVAAVLAAALLVAGNRMYGEFVLGGLARTENARRKMPFRTRQERKAWLERSDRFAALALARRQRDVASELLPFLQDPAEPLRLRAVKLLGRLESAQAEASLEALANRLKGPGASVARKHADSSRVSEAVREESMFPTLDLALARIRARNLNGWTKVQALAKSVGLSFDEVVRLSHKVNDPVEGKYASGSAGYEIVDEMVDMLYQMGKRGEDIRPVANRLTLRPAQKVKLQAASLPLEQEITLILNYLSQVKMVGGSEFDLAEHLSASGAPASNAVIRRIRDALQRSEQRLQDSTVSAAGCSILFRFANRADDTRAIPLLKQFEKKFKDDFVRDSNSPEGWIYAEAQRAREDLEKEFIKAEQQPAIPGKSPTRRRGFGLRRR